MKYMKKPTTIQAGQYMGGTISEDFLLDGLTNGTLYYESGKLYCKTLTGIQEVRESNYIIQGAQDELYPCDMDIFLETYEVVE